MHILIADYCLLAHEFARHFYLNRALTNAKTRYSCFGAGLLGGIQGIPNTQIGAVAPTASDVIEQSILAQHAEWFAHLRTAVRSGGYDTVELPSYYPFAHLVKEMLSVRLRFVLHGMNSQLLAASYENHSSLFEYVRAWRKLERMSLDVADEIVATSLAEKQSFEEKSVNSAHVSVFNPLLFIPRPMLAPSIQPAGPLLRTDVLHLVYAGPLDGVHQPHRLTELKPRARHREVRFKAYGASFKFHSNETSDVISSISPQIEIFKSVDWWDLEHPDVTIVVYPGRANVSWLPIYAVLRGYSVCLSDGAGCKDLFEACGLTYYRFDDTNELRPFSQMVRTENVERLLAALSSSAFDSSIEVE